MTGANAIIPGVKEYSPDYVNMFNNELFSCSCSKTITRAATHSLCPCSSPNIKERPTFFMGFGGLTKCIFIFTPFSTYLFIYSQIAAMSEIQWLTYSCYNLPSIPVSDLTLCQHSVLDVWSCQTSRNPWAEVGERVTSSISQKIYLPTYPFGYWTGQIVWFGFIFQVLVVRYLLLKHLPPPKYKRGKWKFACLTQSIKNV